ncbi:cysteine desulfurase family protein [Acidisphaera sp. L21]|uniref:cysteine desulfurase family protein n=1 Tax=Acidisphaera sp. L21 TaxID=1641851 RepID=UPI00131B1812|nr:aminotransferase class V-fold PLP-dependent enzyme [Acidisphaera sp. L21]
MRVYLDNQATTPCDPRVVDAMLPFFTERFGNAHSAEHAMGQESEHAVETARAQLAALIAADPREIVFTSGATEANNIAIKGAARYAATQGSERRRVITVATEHKCVLDSVADLRAEGFDPLHLPVGPDGLLDPAILHSALSEPTLLVSVMAANNETGVLQDLPTLAALAHQAGALFHTDAAQALGKIPFDVAGIDLASFSAHKLYGPKGVGALYVRRRPRARLLPLFSGGGQERGLRSGTLPTPLIVGFGEACRIAGLELQSESARLASLRDRLLAGLRDRLPGLRINGSMVRRLPGNLNITLPHRDALAAMRAAPDLYVSTGSACSSAEIAPSYVLAAMGLDPAAAARSLRVGLGRFTSPADIDFAISALSAVSEPVEA